MHILCLLGSCTIMSAVKLSSKQKRLSISMQMTKISTPKGHLSHFWMNNKLQNITISRSTKLLTANAMYFISILVCVKNAQL